MAEPCNLIPVSDEPSQSTEDKESATQQAGDCLHIGNSFSSFQHALDELKKDGNHPFSSFQ